MEEKSHIKYFIIKLVIYAAIAVCVFIFREQLVAEEALKYFIGGLMVLYGLEEIFFEILNHKGKFIHKAKTYLGLVELVLGVFLLVSTLEYASVCVIWATWSIMRESFEIREIVTEYKSAVPIVISGLESVAVIVLSIMLILQPHEEHALIHMYLLFV